MARRRGAGVRASDDVGREDVGPGQELARGLRPGADERGLEGGRERARDPHHGVAPVLLGVGVAEPLVAHRHAAREARRAPSITIARRWLRLWKRVSLPKRGGAERLDLPPGRLERVHVLVGGLHAAEAVEQDAHLHARPRALDEGGEDLVARLSRLPDVDGEVDRVLRGAEVLQEGGEEGHAVVEELHGAARAHGRARRSRDGGQELRRPDGREPR